MYLSAPMNTNFNVIFCVTQAFVKPARKFHLYKSQKKFESSVLGGEPDAGV